MRMRLTIEVLPLLPENAHGPHQAAALAAFKARKFALPVETNINLREVWSMIEERYTRNYLDLTQATCFTIKKLQDAYDCDLDLDDTVGAIFEDERDNHMRMIKVVPSFVNRMFSMPPTSNLRPAGASKRVRETNEERANKRRNMHEQREFLDEDPVRDQLLPSTELDPNGEINVESTSAQTQRAIDQRARSKTGTSVVLLENVQTGNAEFCTQIKDESPELGAQPPARSTATIPRPNFKKPLLPASRLSVAVRQNPRPAAIASRRLSKEALQRQYTDEIGAEQDNSGVVDVEDVPKPTITPRKPRSDKGRKRSKLGKPRSDKGKKRGSRSDVSNRHDKEETQKIAAGSPGGSAKASRTHQDESSPPGTPATPPMDPDRLTASVRKTHKSVMKKMFPSGHSTARKQEDKTREALGATSKNAPARKARKRADVVEEAATSFPNAGREDDVGSTDLGHQLQSAAAMHHNLNDETPEPHVVQSNNSSFQPTAKDPVSKTPPWNSESWEFPPVHQQDDTTEQPGAAGQEGAEADVEMMNAKLASNSAPNSSSASPSKKDMAEPRSELEAEDAEESESASAANTAMSSPEVGRRPARFLSHSPTPDKSDSEEESEASPSRSQSPAASPNIAIGDENSDSDNSSSSDDASDGAKSSESENDQNSTDPRAANPPFSLAESLQRSVTLIPATQPSPLRNLPRPAVSPSTRLVSASQPNPATKQNSFKTQLNRAPYRFGSSFPTVGEQLASVRKSEAAKPENRTFDAKTQSLKSLAKGKKNPFADNGSSDSSEDESSASSSEGDGQGESAGSCSVV